jgi:hypothetical protein
VPELILEVDLRPVGQLTGFLSAGIHLAPHLELVNLPHYKVECNDNVMTFVTR